MVKASRGALRLPLSYKQGRAAVLRVRACTLLRAHHCLQSIFVALRTGGVQHVLVARPAETGGCQQLMSSLLKCRVPRRRARGKEQLYRKATSMSASNEGIEEDQRRTHELAVVKTKLW